MKIIIDIPDNVFKRLVAGEVKYGGITARNIFNSVKEGTPYEERPTGGDFPFRLSYCPTCGNSMWGYENGKIVCAICGNTMADTIADMRGGSE